MTVPVVTSVSLDGQHRFSKAPAAQIMLLTGLGVQGDAHAGATVQHRSRVAADPTQPNLRQVHLIQSELHAQLRSQGFDVAAGQLGENITTRGIDLLALPRGAVLRIGSAAVIQITGLRNPCQQINAFAPGMLRAVLATAPDGEVVRKAGVMGIVLSGGAVAPGDRIALALPAPPLLPLKRV